LTGNYLAPKGKVFSPNLEIPVHSVSSKQQGMIPVILISREKRVYKHILVLQFDGAKEKLSAMLPLKLYAPAMTVTTPEAAPDRSIAEYHTTSQGEHVRRFSTRRKVISWLPLSTVSPVVLRTSPWSWLNL
jgi:hypothetical protein